MSTAVSAGLLTLLRVVVLIALGEPDLGADRGVDRAAAAVAERVQPLAQFLAAFPANVLFPFAVVAIVAPGTSTPTSGCRR